MIARPAWLSVLALVLALAGHTALSQPTSAAGIPGDGSTNRAVLVPANYCGTPSLDVPDQTYLFDFGSACQSHDVCYGVGGSEADRANCDQAFLNAMQASCIAKWPVNGPWDVLNARSRVACNNYARLYYFAVRIGGGSSFNYTPV